MILTPLSDTKSIEALHPLFGRLFRFVKEKDLAALPAGRIELEGERLFINVSETALVAQEEQKLEVHRQYVDVHIPVSGPEVIGWAPLSSLTVASEKPFDAEHDFALYVQPAREYVRVLPGECFVCFPEDAHAPVIGAKGTPHKKLIAKVML